MSTMWCKSFRLTEFSVFLVASSDWPTIPQVYIDGEFIGGCDIITSMHESGELSEVLKDKE